MENNPNKRGLASDALTRPSKEERWPEMVIATMGGRATHKAAELPPAQDEAQPLDENG